MRVYLIGCCEGDDDYSDGDFSDPCEYCGAPKDSPCYYTETSERQVEEEDDELCDRCPVCLDPIDYCLGGHARCDCGELAGTTDCTCPPEKENT